MFSERLDTLRSRARALDVTLDGMGGSSLNDDTSIVAALRRAHECPVSLDGYVPLLSVCVELCVDNKAASAPRIDDIMAGLNRLRSAGIVAAVILRSSGILEHVAPASRLSDSADASASCWRIVEAFHEVSVATAAATVAATATSVTHEHDWRYKTELCRCWVADGTCARGARCTFAHGESELRAHVASSAGAASNRKKKERRKLRRREKLAALKHTNRRELAEAEEAHNAQIHLPVDSMLLPPMLDDTSVIGAMLRASNGGSAKGRALFDDALIAYETLFDYIRTQQASGAAAGGGDDGDSMLDGGGDGSDDGGDAGGEGGGGDDEAKALPPICLPARPLRRAEWLSQCRGEGSGGARAANCIVDGQNVGPEPKRFLQIMLLSESQALSPLFILPRTDRYTSKAWPPLIRDRIVWAPPERESEAYDDLFVINAAMERDAILISNDRYRDVVSFYARDNRPRAAAVEDFLARKRRAWALSAHSGTFILTHVGRE